MLEKGFLNDNSRRKTTKNRNASLIGKLMVAAGAIIVIAGLIFVMMNLKEVDGIAKTWLPYIVAGSVLVLAGVVVLRFKKR